MKAINDLKDALKRTLDGMGVSEAEIQIEHPGELAHGDYATGAALQYAKRAGTKPRELAEKIVEKLGSIEGVSKIEVAGAGFINFYLSPEAISGVIEEARTNERWGANSNQEGKKTIVEYTDPNPFKEFHIGHLVTNAIGESISRLFAFSGADVRRANYQGDVGRHVARAIWGLLQNKESPEDVQALGRAYAAGAKADEGDAGLWRKEVVLAHIKDGFFRESDGATVYEGEKKGLHTRVFLNSEGLPTYEAEELGLSQMKYEKFP